MSITVTVGELQAYLRTLPTDMPLEGFRAYDRGGRVVKMYVCDYLNPEPEPAFTVADLDRLFTLPDPRS